MEFLKKLLEKKNDRINELREAIQTSENIDDVKRFGSEITSLESEIADIRNEITARESEPKFDPTKVIGGADYVPDSKDKRSENKFETMEYREAFRDYVTRGTVSEILEQRSSTGTSADLGSLGVVIPLTVMNEIMQSLTQQRKYGQLYSRVKKTNLKGGIKYPIGSFEATFNRITEATGVSSAQHVGEITGSVTFEYKIGEIRLERTLLESVLTVPEFEQKFAETVARAYLKAMDNEILRGVAANNQCEGIITEASKASSRIDATHIIDFTATEMADWKEWRKKLFAKIPLAMRAETLSFVMTPNTFEANILTLADENNRPLATDTYNPVNGDEIARFNGKEVVFVEDNQLGNFDDITSATTEKYFGLYWAAEKAYAINSNLEFSVIDYFDHDTNKYIKKAIVINDGKVLNPDYVFLLRKAFTQQDE